MCCSSSHGSFAFEYPVKFDDWERCRCTGLPEDWAEDCRCTLRATGEDGRCGGCRSACQTVEVWDDPSCGWLLRPVALVPFPQVIK